MVDEPKLCQMSGHSQGDRCAVCGYVLAHDLPVPLRRACGGAESVHMRRGLGDWVEAKLKTVGITKPRYIALRKLLGLKAECGCQSRRLWLNAFGWSIELTLTNLWRRIVSRFLAGG